MNLEVGLGLWSQFNPRFFGTFSSYLTEHVLTNDELPLYFRVSFVKNR